MYLCRKALHLLRHVVQGHPPDAATACQQGALDRSAQLLGSADDDTWQAALALLHECSQNAQALQLMRQVHVMVALLVAVLTLLKGECCQGYFPTWVCVLCTHCSVDKSGMQAGCICHGFHLHLQPKVVLPCVWQQPGPGILPLGSMLVEAADVHVSKWHQVPKWHQSQMEMVASALIFSI